jgi:hypothetical protein
MATEMTLQSTLTCPHCGHQVTETMPTNACQFFYDCAGCGELLRPNLVTAACSVPTAACRARRCSCRHPAAVIDPTGAWRGWQTSSGAGLELVLSILRSYLEMV